MTPSHRTARTAASLLVLACALCLLMACGEEPNQPVEMPVNESEPQPTEPQPAEALATFGGGCFWCTEAIFQELRGVFSVESGYSGGGTEQPTYEDVCSGMTGHAEAIQVRYDPSVVTYAQLLEVFFKTHNPTTLNRQGADFGTQYRSVVFAHDAAQRETASTIKSALDEASAYSDPIVTEIVDLEAWFPAEAVHQDYYASNAQNGYCQAVIQPKLEAFRRVFAERLEAQD